ncbi:MAG: transposase [Candidatus Omnitrophota bacterium]
MPRTKRFIPPGDAALHIRARGNNRLYLFQEDSDKAHYLRVIQELKEENKIDIFHYSLMSNHAHMIVWLEQAHNLSRFMKQLQLRYFNYYKSTYGYAGHLWQGRFKSSLIDTDAYLMQCGKYIELNPVRAGLVARPEDYAFSSYRYYAYGSNDALITPNPAYLGLSDRAEERRKQYIAFVVDSSIINSQKLQAQLFIGSNAFIRKLEEYYQTRNTALRRGRPGRAEK